MREGERERERVRGREREREGGSETGRVEKRVESERQIGNGI